MARNKDIFFYSNMDSYSINCINIIIRNNIKNKFNYICIDGRIQELPSIINKVPCILTTSRNIKIDGQVMEYIREIINKSSQSNNGNAQQQTIEDYMNGNDIYQFIDKEDHDNMDTNGDNNSQLKSCSLLDEGFSLITQEAKEGKVNMGGKKEVNYENNLDRKLPDAPINKPSQQHMTMQQPQIFMQNNNQINQNNMNQNVIQNNNFQQQHMNMIQQRGPNMPQNINAMEAISQQTMPQMQQNNHLNGTPSINDGPIKNINLDSILAQRNADIQNLIKPA
jgi:hypothetical protein